MEKMLAVLTASVKMLLQSAAYAAKGEDCRILLAQLDRLAHAWTVYKANEEEA